MAIAQIERLAEQSGGFGTFLLMAHEWADREATLRSYELFAREVVPHFKGTLGSLERSRDWAAENRPEFIGAVGGAIMQAISDHHAEREAKQGPGAGDRVVTPRLRPASCGLRPVRGPGVVGRDQAGAAARRLVHPPHRRQWGASVASRAPSGVALGHDALERARPALRGSGGSRSRWARS